jgi:hypothetical protein
MRERSGQREPDGIGTILVSKEPFSEQDISIITKVVKQMQFEIVLSPQYALNKTFTMLESSQNIEQFLNHFPINIGRYPVN